MGMHDIIQKSMCRARVRSHVIEHVDMCCMLQKIMHVHVLTWIILPLACRAMRSYTLWVRVVVLPEPAPAIMQRAHVNQGFLQRSSVS